MRTGIGILVGLAFLTAMIFASLQETRVRCEICLEFQGNRTCRAGSGADEASATQIAVSTACAELASNRTQNIRCQATHPTSRVCE